MELELEGKTAVVTGAGRGIGLAITKALAEEGVRVVGGARTITAELKDTTPLTFAVDLATPEGPGQLIDFALAEFGGIDLLVNNVAGSQGGGGFRPLSEEDWSYTMDASLFSAVRATRAALDSLIERRGSIVNIGSIVATHPNPQKVAYSVAKAGMANFGRALAQEFGATGLRVNTISPGVVRTDLWTTPGTFGEAMAQQMGIPLEQLVDRLPGVLGIPTGLIAEPEEIASLVLLLASRKLPNVNGADYMVDGGSHIKAYNTPG